MRRTKQPFLVTVPSLVEHNDFVPSVKGGREHSLRGGDVAAGAAPGRGRLWTTSGDSVFLSVLLALTRKRERQGPTVQRNQGFRRYRQRLAKEPQWQTKTRLFPELPEDLKALSDDERSKLLGRARGSEGPDPRGRRGVPGRPLRERDHRAARDGRGADQAAQGSRRGADAPSSRLPGQEGRARRPSSSRCKAEDEDEGDGDAEDEAETKRKPPLRRSRGRGDGGRGRGGAGAGHRLRRDRSHAPSSLQPRSLAKASARAHADRPSVEEKGTALVASSQFTGRPPRTARPRLARAPHAGCRERSRLGGPRRQAGHPPEGRSVADGHLRGRPQGRARRRLHPVGRPEDEGGTGGGRLPGRAHPRRARTTSRRSARCFPRTCTLRRASRESTAERRWSHPVVSAPRSPRSTRCPTSRPRRSRCGTRFRCSSAARGGVNVPDADLHRGHHRGHLLHLGGERRSRWHVRNQVLPGPRLPRSTRRRRSTSSPTAASTGT